MYRLLLQSRDRKEGKGLWSISLYLLCVVANEDYPRFLDIFRRFVGDPVNKKNFTVTDRLGCWRDYRELQSLLQKDDYVAEYVEEETRKAQVRASAASEGL